MWADDDHSERFGIPTSDGVRACVGIWLGLYSDRVGTPMFAAAGTVFATEHRDEDSD